MTIPDPPPGWSALQAKARRAKDPSELASLIDDMNRLLSQYEKSGEIDENARGECAWKSRQVKQR
jgi:hypothetical protein